MCVLNFHGGNFILNQAIREWNLDGRFPRMMHLDVYNALAETTGSNLHACDLETSAMLRLKPDLVHQDRAADFVPSNPGSDLTHFSMRELAPDGAWGYPSRATAEKGERILEELVAYGAERILRLREDFKKLHR